MVNGFFDGETRDLARRRRSASSPPAPAATSSRRSASRATRSPPPRSLKSPPRADRRRPPHLTSTDDGAPAVRHFINIASFGIGGLVDRYVNQSSKTLGGKVSFAVATLKAGARYKNASGAPGPRRRPGARGQDLQRRRGQRPLLRRRHEGRARRRARRRPVRRHHARRLRLRRSALARPRHLQRQALAQPEGDRAPRAHASRPTPIDGAEVLLDVDGEAPGRLPATFELLAGALQVRCRREQTKQRHDGGLDEHKQNKERTPPFTRPRWSRPASARSPARSCSSPAPTSTSGRSPGSPWRRSSAVALAPVDRDSPAVYGFSRGLFANGGGFYWIVPLPAALRPSAARSPRSRSSSCWSRIRRSPSRVFAWRVRRLHDRFRRRRHLHRAGRLRRVRAGRALRLPLVPRDHPGVGAPGHPDRRSDRPARRLVPARPVQRRALRRLVRAGAPTGRCRCRASPSPSACSPRRSATAWCASIR